MANTLTYSFIQKQMKQSGCELLSNAYINNKTPLTYRCVCGNISTITWLNFRVGKRCRNCQKNKMRGERYQHQIWRKKVLDRDNWQCRACDITHVPLHAVRIINDKDFWYKVSNGFTLCAACHMRFRATYGKNTSWNMLSKWLKKYYNRSLADG